MDNQQRSPDEDNFIKHPIYDLCIGDKGNIIDSITRLPRYVNIGKSGYVVTQVRASGKIRTLKVHRLVAEVFLEKPSPELEALCRNKHWGKVLVLHNDNNKLNNAVPNLRWGSQLENTEQAYRDGLIPALKGSLNGRSVLTEETVHDVCKFYEEGGGPKDAILKFGISRPQATKIRAGISWKHVSCNYKILPMRERSTISRKT